MKYGNQIAVAVVAILAALILFSCGGSSSNPPSTPPASATVDIIQQPASISVVAPAPAQFNVLATTTSGNLNYQWQVINPGSKTPTNIGTNSPAFEIDPTAVTQNGAVFTVQVSADADPVNSAPATLTVTQPSESQPPVTPLFSSATAFPYCNQPTGCAPNPTPSIFNTTVPSLASGIAIVCFNYNGTQTQIPGLVNAVNVVTDTNNDSFQLLNYLPLAWEDYTDFDACFGAATSGGQNIVFTVNMTSQTQSSIPTIQGVVLNYAGAYDGIQVEAFSSSSGTTTANSVFASPPITFTNSRLVICLAVDNTAVGVGAGWTTRFESLNNFLVEDQIVTGGQTIDGEAYITSGADVGATAWGAAVMALN